MSRQPKKTDPLATMADADPAQLDELAAEIDQDEIERALVRATALGRVPSQPIPPGDGAATGIAHRRVTFGLGLAAVATLAAVLVVSGWFGGSGGGRPEFAAGPEFAAAAIQVAEANPRLLVTAPGWEIVRADEFEADSGELTFSDGTHRFSVHWYPANLYRDYLRDRADVSAPEHGTLLGLQTTTVDYTRGIYATMLPPQGNVFIEVLGQLGSRPAYDAILHSLRPVDVETWLGAMPPSTVRPEARAETVERMLRDIPLPPGFDATSLQGEDSISNHDSLAVKVGNAVACAWVESWIAADAAGDRPAAQRAIEAMASSPDWPIVHETGVPWFANYEIVTEQLRAGRLDTGDSVYGGSNGRSFAYGPAWKLLLGCEGTYRREIDELPRNP